MVEKDLNVSNIYEALVEIDANMGNWQSDLYVTITPEVDKLMSRYADMRNVGRFRSNIDGKMNYEIPFAYTPYWEARSTT